MAFTTLSSEGIPDYTTRQGVSMLDVIDERPTVVTQDDADRLNVISTSNAFRTTVTVADGITVLDSAAMTAQVIQIPKDVSSAHLFFDSTDTAAKFTFTIRMTATGNDFSSPSLADITLASQREGHIVNNLDGVHYLVINYTNSSGSSNTLSIWFVHASTQS